MEKKVSYVSFLPFYIPVLMLFLFAAAGWSRGVTTILVNAPVTERRTVIIDAGHGGFDGGAASCTGRSESEYNLEIALRLDDLLHLLGINTVMVRTSDTAVNTGGNTIAQKKVSDLKERVALINGINDAILISIHQNQFRDSRYSGAQVFFAPTVGSEQMARTLQAALISTVNPTSHREIKRASSVYLMQNIHCTGILVECGFLSNPTEERKLRDPDYQKKLCSVIAATTSAFLFS